MPIAAAPALARHARDRSAEARTLVERGGDPHPSALRVDHVDLVRPGLGRGGAQHERVELEAVWISRGAVGRRDHGRGRPRAPAITRARQGDRAVALGDLEPHREQDALAITREARRAPRGPVLAERRADQRARFIDHRRGRRLTWHGHERLVPRHARGGGAAARHDHRGVGEEAGVPLRVAHIALVAPAVGVRGAALEAQRPGAAGGHARPSLAGPAGPGAGRGAVTARRCRGAEAGEVRGAGPRIRAAIPPERERGRDRGVGRHAGIGR